MPATSRNQRVAAAIAEHHPDQLYARNRSMLKMSQKSLHDYAATKGLSGQRHDHTPQRGFAHAGTTREGTHLSSAGSRGKSAGVAGSQEPKAFAYSGTSKPGAKATPAATASGSAPNGRPRISRRGEGFSTNMTGGGRAGKTAGAGHFGVDRGRSQEKGTGGYEAARPGNRVATDKITGPKMQQGPKRPVKKQGPKAFRDVPGASIAKALNKMGRKA